MKQIKLVIKFLSSFPTRHCLGAVKKKRLKQEMNKLHCIFSTELVYLVGERNMRQWHFSWSQGCRWCQWTSPAASPWLSSGHWIRKLQVEINWQTKKSTTKNFIPKCWLLRKERAWSEIATACYVMKKSISTRDNDMEKNKTSSNAAGDHGQSQSDDS